jgi:hypothetical protein
VHWADVRAYCEAVIHRLEALEGPGCFPERQAIIRALVRRVEIRGGRLRIVGALPRVSSDDPTGLSTQHVNVWGSRRGQDAAGPCPARHSTPHAR